MAPDQLELFGYDGRYLGALAYRGGRWRAFSPARLLGAHADLGAAQGLLERATGFCRPAARTATWERRPGRLELVAAGEVIATVQPRGVRWLAMLGSGLLVAEERDEGSACQAVAEIMCAEAALPG